MIDTVSTAIHGPDKFLCAQRCTALAPRVSNGYTNGMMKDSGFRIRVQRDLRDQFLEACHAHDRPAAQVLREFMRRYIANHESELAEKAATESHHEGAGRVSRDQRAK